MDALRRVDLRIVQVDRVHPHEVADPDRELRIEKRLRADGVLRDPLLVGAIRDVDGYILLDGTNRRRALTNLRLPYALVQVIDYADPHAVQLRTWSHSIHRPLGQVLDEVARIPDLVISSLPPLATAEALTQPSTITVLLDQSERFSISRPPDAPTSRVEQLRQFVDLYEAGMTRVDCDPEEIEERVQSMNKHAQTVLAGFPSFTRSQVVAMAMGGLGIPAGITRHVILGGRALRVNVPLRLLSGDVPVEEADFALSAHMGALQPRLYQEPTILYDS